jgi:circadian clock protein KaiC
MSEGRIPSGIAGLDSLIEGGFPAGKSYLVTGEAGVGKTIFSIQFVLKGLADREKAVYVSVNEKPTDVVDAATSLGWDLKPHIEQKNLLILDASPYFSSRMGASKEREVDVQKIVGDLASYVKRMGAGRLVIDPVSPLIQTREALRGSQEHIRTLVHSLQDHLKTTNLLTSYAASASAGVTEPVVEEYIVAGVITLHLKPLEKRLVRTLLVRKMRATAIDLIEREFSIHKPEGIALKPDF